MTNTNQPLYAALDLGSNSFHMIIMRKDVGQLEVIDKLRESVRLAAGLDDKGNITKEVMGRALKCLTHFAQRINESGQVQVRVVGTNTLRKAKNAAIFIKQAEAILQNPIEIIAGREEARLIYLGVAHSISGEQNENRLVVDIGGGSTELIVGKQFEPIQRESLHMGCVSFSNRYFPDGKISAEAIMDAEIDARLELRSIVGQYRKLGWDTAIGASGTIKALADICAANEWSTQGVTLEALKALKEKLHEVEHISDLKIKGLSDERLPVFPGGLIVLLAVFEALGIQQMQVSNWALREGVVLDLIGRNNPVNNIRNKTLIALLSRTNRDVVYAKQVKNLVEKLFDKCADKWDIAESQYRNFLGWAAQLCELGQIISHSQYHKHGAYWLQHADLSGFSRQEQNVVAFLIRAHRRKLPIKEIEAGACSVEFDNLIKMIILLRVALMLNRSRNKDDLPEMKVKVSKKQIKLKFTEDWLQTHPLTRADLKKEARLIEAAGYSLTVMAID
jgi:exopolyphosphatase/guanosine-5'-triphosphate,3'-diphosphate pyrophosphatase